MSEPDVSKMELASKKQVCRMQIFLNPEQNEKVRSRYRYKGDFSKLMGYLIDHFIDQVPKDWRERT